MVVFIHSMFPTANGIITMIMSQVVFYFGKPNTSSIEMHRIVSISFNIIQSLRYSNGCVWKCCVPLNPMVFLIIVPIKWLFHWEYTQHFQTNPNDGLFCAVVKFQSDPPSCLFFWPKRWRKPIQIPRDLDQVVLAQLFYNWVWINYLLIPFFRGMNIHKSQLNFDVNYRGTRFWHTANS